MWRLLNKLFGWEYVYADNSITSMVTRVKIAPNGEKYFQPYPFQIHIIERPIPTEGIDICGWRVVPLTPKVTSQV
jgi:hypothetical protein